MHILYLFWNFITNDSSSDVCLFVSHFFEVISLICFSSPALYQHRFANLQSNVYAKNSNNFDENAERSIFALHGSTHHSNGWFSFCQFRKRKKKRWEERYNTIINDKFIYKFTLMSLKNHQFPRLKWANLSNVYLHLNTWQNN